MVSNCVWDVCSYFMEHLQWHKPRLVLLGPKIEALPDAHPSKPRCLFELSKLFSLVGNHTESRRILIRTLKLWRERGDEFEVAQTLMWLSDVNWMLDPHEEGTWQVKEAFPDALTPPPSDDDSDSNASGTLWATSDDTEGALGTWQSTQLDRRKSLPRLVVDPGPRPFPLCQQQKAPGPGPLLQLPPFMPVAFEQVKNASLALSTPAESPSEPKRAYRGKRSGPLKLTIT